MNKRNIILLSLVAVAAIVLILQRTVKPRALEQLPEWKAEADTVLIGGPKGEVELTKSGANWIVAPGSYTADTSRVTSLLNTLRDMKILEKISDREYYDKYDLTDAAGIPVRVKSGDTVLLDIIAGKVSPAGSMTYIRYPGTAGIYLVSESLRTDLERDVQYYRDKKIIAVDSGEIEKISIENGKYTLVRILPTAGAGDGSSGEAVWKLLSDESVQIDQDAAAALARAAAAVTAYDFPENEEKPQEILWQTDISAMGKVTTLVIHLKDEEDFYLCSSSASQYIFRLSAYNAENIMKDLSDLTSGGEE